MHQFLFGLFLLLSFLLSSCQPNKSDTSSSNPIINPQYCEKETDSSSKCQMNWVLNYKGVSFPQNVEITINDDLVYNECKPSPKVTVTRGSSLSSMTIWNFVSVDKIEPFKLVIKDKGNCYSTPIAFYEFASQTYAIKMQDGASYVSVDFGSL